MSQAEQALYHLPHIADGNTESNPDDDGKENITDVFANRSDGNTPIAYDAFSEAVREYLGLTDADDLANRGSSSFAPGMRKRFCERVLKEDQGSIYADTVFRVVLPCWEVHPGVCVIRDASTYKVLLACGKRFRATVYSDEGNLGACYALESAPGNERLYFCVAHKRGSNPKLVISCLCRLEADVLHLQYDADGMLVYRGEAAIFKAFFASGADIARVATISLLSLLSDPLPNCIDVVRCRGEDPCIARRILWGETQIVPGAADREPLSEEAQRMRDGVAFLLPARARSSAPTGAVIEVGPTVDGEAPVIRRSKVDRKRVESGSDSDTSHSTDSSSSSAARAKPPLVAATQRTEQLATRGSSSGLAPPTAPTAASPSGASSSAISAPPIPCTPVTAPRRTSKSDRFPKVYVPGSNQTAYVKISMNSDASFDFRAVCRKCSDERGKEASFSRTGRPAPEKPNLPASRRARGGPLERSTLGRVGALRTLGILGQIMRVSRRTWHIVARAARWPKSSVPSQTALVGKSARAGRLVRLWILQMASPASYHKSTKFRIRPQIRGRKSAACVQ